MTPNINSPTAKELATKSIVELSCIVYQNALAVKAMIDALDVDAINALVGRAESAAADASNAATNAEASAATADAFEDLAMNHATDAEYSAQEAARFANAAAETFQEIGVAIGGKLDKISNHSGHNSVYAVSNVGEQIMRVISNRGETYARGLVQYQDGGTLRTAEPTQSYHAATKSYVDSHAGGGGLSVLNWEGSSYTTSDGRGVVLIITRVNQGTTHVFGIPPIAAAHSPSLEANDNGLTMSVDWSGEGWQISFSESVWMTMLFV